MAALGRVPALAALLLTFPLAGASCPDPAASDGGMAGDGDGDGDAPGDGDGGGDGDGDGDAPGDGDGDGGTEARDGGFADDGGSATDAGVRDGGAIGGDGDGDGDLVPWFAGCPTSSALPVSSSALTDGAFEVACGSFDVEVWPFAADVVRVAFRDPAIPDPAGSWAVTAAPDPALDVQVGQGADGSFALCTARLAVTVTAACAVDVVDTAGVTVLHHPSGAYSQVAGQASVSSTLVAGEPVFGLGERTGAFNRRGRSHIFWNTDVYQDAFGGYPPDQDPLYQAIPFYQGLRAGRAYGVFVDNTHRLVVDVGDAVADQLTWDAEGGELVEYVLAGPAFSDVLGAYAGLTGTPPLPPRWALGYHQSRWGYPDDDRVVEVMQEFRSRGLPADGIWLDIQHMDGFRSFTFDPVAFDDPEGLITYADGIGFRTVLIVDPGIKVDPGWSVYDEGVAAGHFLTGTDGQPYVGEVWPGPAAWPDFTSPAARAWWAGHVAATRERGVAGLWIDMNEPANFIDGGSVPNHVAAAGDGAPTTMAEVHNVFGHNMARATRAGLQQGAPDERPFILTRSGYAGTHRYAAVWTGDAPSSWATLQTTLPMLLGMSMSGQPFVGSDVGGYSGGASPELFARWMALGSFSPFFRGHVTTGVNDQEPWAFGVEVEYISKTVMTERYRLLPYLYSLFDGAARTGEPVLRPLVYAHADDAATWDVGDEALLGPWLLYAPVVEPGASTRSVYLPAGRWLEYRSNRLYEGPATVEVPLRLEALPAFVKEGAIVPHGPALQHTDEAPLSPLTLDVFPGPGATSFAHYEDDGHSLAFANGAYRRVTYTLAGRTDGATLTAGAPEGSYDAPSRTLVVRVRRVDDVPAAVRVDGVALTPVASAADLAASGEGYFLDDADRSLLVAFADRAPFVLDVDYDPSVVAPADLVEVPVTVTVPPGTPGASAIHIATSASGWTHQALAWSPDLSSASGTVLVPRGEWFEYKYTRGDWDSVEKWPGCLEATNRYAFGAAHPGKLDHVDVWADTCP